MKLALKKLLCGLCVFFSSMLSATFDTPRKFVIVSASFNNIKWAEKSLNSIFSQKHSHFRVIYCDDCSTDGTREFVENYIKENKLENRIKLVKNAERVGPHLNIYRAVHSCDDDEIVVIVDGDDSLADDNVLTKLSVIYSDLSVWMTYGQCLWYPDGCLGSSKQLPDDVLKHGTVRKYSKFVTSHLRSFYAWLYKRIKIEHLFFEGKFIWFLGDYATMFPMIEMAGEHSRFISDVLYIYNNANELNYRKLRKNKKVLINERQRLEAHLRSIEPYSKLEFKDLPGFMQKNRNF